MGQTVLYLYHEREVIHMKMYLEVINGYEVWFDGDCWVVEDEYGLTPYETRQDARQAAEEG